jgi:hypothetical protein
MHSESRSPRLPVAKAWTSSITIVESVSNRCMLSGWLSRRLSDSGVVSSMCGGRTRWRALRSDGVSPVRVSTRSSAPSPRSGRAGCAARRPPAPSAARRRACAGHRRGFSSEIDEARQETRQRLAGAGGCDEQGMRARAPGIEHLELIAARRPAALREPRGDGAASCRPGMCWARRRSWSSMPRACASSSPATTSASATRPAPVRAGAMRYLHHRGDLRPAGVPPSPADLEVAEAAGIRPALPRAQPYRRRLCARQGAARHGADPRGRLRRPLYIHGAMEKLTEFYLEGARSARSARSPRRLKPIAKALGGEIVICPPSAIQDLWARKFPDPSPPSPRAGCGSASARGRRGVELPLDHLRPCRLGRSHRRPSRRSRLRKCG